jgi:hypothetical protein
MPRTRGTLDDPALHIGVDTGNAVTVVTPVGVLAMPTAPGLRRVLLACLAEQPDAVIADLTLLHVQTHHLLSVFPAAARRSAQWTGAELILVTGPPSAHQYTSVGAIARFLRVYPTMEVALTATGRLSANRRLATLCLTPSRSAVPHARGFIRHTCRSWGCASAADAAETIGAELVGNAVRHTGGESTLRLELRRTVLTVSVGDHSRTPAVPRTSSPAGGFGLRIVDAMADDWDSTPSRDGKTVWALLHTG